MRRYPKKDRSEEGGREGRTEGRKEGRETVSAQTTRIKELAYSWNRKEVNVASWELGFLFLFFSHWEKNYLPSFKV